MDEEEEGEESVRGPLKGLEKGGRVKGVVRQGRRGGRRWCPVKLAHRNASHTSGHLGLGGEVGSFCEK